MKENITQLQRQVDVLMKDREGVVVSQSPSSTTTNSQMLQQQHRETIEDLGNSSESEGGNSPAYAGLTSSKFGFDIAKASLEAGRPKNINQPAETILTSSNISDRSRRSTQPVSAASTHPLLILQKAEVLEMVQTYQDWIGIIYPCLNVESVRQYVLYLYDEKPTSHNNHYTMHGRFDEDSRFDRDLEILKSVLACALTVKGLRHSSLAEQLMNSVQDTFYQRMKIVEVDMKELLILVLMSTYHFHNNQEVMAWRVLGLAARGCLEMGLHRRSTWDHSGGIFPGDLQRSWAMRVFWCIYVLDRRYSLGTGLPFAIEERDIDTELPSPEESTPYLTCMIAYGKLSSKIWKLVSEDCSSASILVPEENAVLEEQVLEWYHSDTPEYLRYLDPHQVISESTSDMNHILRVTLYLRANQMRLLIYRKSLFSSTSISNQYASAQLVTDIAKDSITTLDKLNNTSDLYRDQPMMFNYFLLSALSVLFLAVCHAPSWFGPTSRPFFNIALDLIKGFPPESLTAKRLKKTVKDLKQLIPKLDPPPNATVPQMNRLNQDQVQTPNTMSDDHHTPNSSNQQNHRDPVLNSTFQLTDDLTNIFEAVGGQYHTRFARSSHAI